MADEIPHTLRGRVLAPHADERRFTLHGDALIRLGPGGTIASLEDAPAGCTTPETWPGTVLLPGLVDVHLHYPQTRIVGSASGTLLPWLEGAVFPEEARFVDLEYAERVAGEFCDAMVAQGTTTAAVFGTSHPGATDVLFEELDRRGMRAAAGMTLMNRGAPAALLRDTDAAMEAGEELVRRWHDHDDGRLRYGCTPRFALSCDAEMMRRAGEQAARHGLLIQTHLSENLEELRRTAADFPDAADYLGVYEQFGLVGERSILAHCIHLSADEWDRLARHRAAVAHCPDSNFFLGSGCMPLAQALQRGIRVGLGTDMGAGRTFSVRRVAAAAYDAAQLVDAPVPPEELLWLATRGGAIALGLEQRIGCIAPGFEADLAAIEVPDHPQDVDLIDALLFRHDAGPVRATVVRGRLLESGASTSGPSTGKR